MQLREEATSSKSLLSPLLDSTSWEDDGDWVSLEEQGCQTAFCTDSAQSPQSSQRQAVTPPRRDSPTISRPASGHNAPQIGGEAQDAQSAVSRALQHSALQSFMRQTLNDSGKGVEGEQRLQQGNRVRTRAENTSSDQRELVTPEMLEQARRCHALSPSVKLKPQGTLVLILVHACSAQALDTDGARPTLIHARTRTGSPGAISRDDPAHVSAQEACRVRDQIQF